MAKTITSRFDVSEHLRTREEMAAYLQACMEDSEGDAAFIAKALGDIARAAGMSTVARDAGVSRESLYKALSGERTPGFDTILKVMSALGMELHPEAKAEPNHAQEKARAVRETHPAWVSSGQFATVSRIDGNVDRLDQLARYFELQGRSGWTSVKSGIVSGYGTRRLGKVMPDGELQLTIGATTRGCQTGLNSTIRHIVRSCGFDIVERQSTSGSRKSSETYPTIRVGKDEGGLLGVLLRVEGAAVQGGVRRS